MEDQQKMNKEKNIRRLIIVSAVFWGLILLAGIVFFAFTGGKVLVDVEYAPFAATVKMNGTTVMNHHSNYIAPGEYQVIVEYENFETYEGTVTVTDGTEYIYGSLRPINELGQAYMDEHSDEFSLVEGIAGKIAVQEGEKQREEYPIIDKLPVKDPYYTIGYSISEDGLLNITVESSISYRQMAVAKLLDITDPEDFERYNVIFYDLDNPYAGKFKENIATDPAQYIKDGFADVGVDFTVEGGQTDGNYYYAYLRYYFRRFVGVIYRIVLISEDGSWHLAADPYPLLTTTNTPDVPLDILNKVNAL